MPESADLTHRMMMLSLQLGVLLFAARLGHMLFEKLRLPGVLGEVFAGILIGPFALGSIPISPLGLSEGLFPPFHQLLENGARISFPVSPELYGFCTVASILLLFLVGLETDLAKFLRYSVAGSLVGVGGVVVAFAISSLTALWFLPRLTGEAHTFLSPPVLLLGVLSTAASVGITARILADKHKLDTPEGVTILAGAVIADVLGIVLLAIGMGIFVSMRGGGGVDWAGIGAIAFKAVGIWLAATVAGILASRRISSLLKAFRDKMSIAILALGLALILAGLFEEARLAMIIGAYVMGLALSRSDISRMVGERLQPIYLLMVPIFFAVIGMLVDVSQLATRATLLFGAVYTLTAIAAKFLGCGLLALLCRFNLRGAARIGAGMVPRGEVALIISGIGLSAGILPPDIFGVGVLMILATTMAAPPLLVRLFRSPHPGIRGGLERAASEPRVYEFPTPEIADLIANKILAVFSEEGYFTHVLDAASDIFQIRKDEVVISFRRDRNSLVFHCDPRDTALIGMALMEVVADLERLVSRLRKPVDRDQIRASVAGSASGVRKSSVLATALRKNALLPKLQGKTKEAVIDELLDALDRAGALKDRAAARQAVFEREAVMSTGMQNGVALPHGRTDAVQSLVFALGLRHEGVEFESLDGSLIRIVLLTLSPVSTATPYVQFMAQFSQRLTPSGRAMLLSCDRTEEMRDWLLHETPTGSGPDASEGGLRSVWRNWVRCRPRDKRLIRPNLVVPRLRGATREDVVDELIQALVAAGCGVDADAARHAVLRRELQMPTGLEHGVALPHARLKGMPKLLCVMGIHHEGVDFGAEDGEPTRIIFLMLYPLAERAPIMRYIAELVGKLDAPGRDRILAARSADEIAAHFADIKAT